MTEAQYLSAVQAALARKWGGSVQVTPVKVFAEHAHVQRLRVEHPPAGAPATLILKRAREGYDPQIEDTFSPAGLLFNDWASLEFVHELFGDNAPAPKLYAADRTAGWLALEDLGDVDPVYAALCGDDPERATTQLVRFGEVLGQLHGRARPRLDHYLKRRQALGCFSPPAPGQLGNFLPEAAQALERLGVDLPAAAWDDVQTVMEALAHLDDFVTLVHNDAAPNNLIESAGRLCLYDFEAATLHPALLEGANLRLHFPTMGLKFTHRLPEAAWRLAEAAYRAALAEGCPAAADEARWANALLAACALWTLACVQGHLSIEWALTADHPHIDHLRQCRLARFDSFVQTAAEFNRLPHLARACAEAAAQLREHWPGAREPLAVYPAFINGMK